MTLCNNLPLVMVMAFLLLTLVVGLYYSRKVTTFREYAVGNKQFATATLIATTLATGIGAPALVSVVEEIHSQGLCWVIVMPLSAFSYWLIRPLAFRMGPFMQHFSIAETLGNVYGSSLRIITALICILASITYIALQIKIMSMAIGTCINNMDIYYTKYTIIGATSVLIFYAVCGGIRSVTFTDILQFVTFTSVIPFLAWFMFVKTDKSIFDIIPILQCQPKFHISSVFTWSSQPIAMISLLLTCFFSAVEPPIMQRVYMASSPAQAKKVFGYCTVFSFIICIFIVLIGIFTFVGSPQLRTERIWQHVMQQIPFAFKGFIAISLLAMAMSTADSNLNSCSVMLSHDILGPIQKRTGIVFSLSPLWIARLTVLLVGISAMIVVFHYDNVYALMLLAIDWYIPMVLAPYILAIFGFRGTSHTAIIGICMGAFTILVWNRLIIPKTGIEGSFFCMLANGLAMLAAHYLLPQPAGTGWVPPDKIYQQRQQEKARIKRRSKQERAIFFTKENLAKLKPNAITLVLVGIYLIVSSLVSSCYYNAQTKTVWACIPFFMLGVGYIGYVAFFANKIPDGAIGKYWFISVLVGFPLHLLFSCFLCKTLLVPFILFFTHGTVLLWTLPFYWSLRGLAITAGGMLVVICCCKATVVWPPIILLLPILPFGLLFLVGNVWAKNSIVQKESRNLYFLQKQATQEAYELKKLAYSEELPTASPQNTLAQEGTILEKAIQNVTQSIAFVDSTTPFLKEDFQSIIDKFAEWAYYLKQRAKRQDQLLLQPTAIPLEALIDAGEVAYQKEKGCLPGLWVEEFVNMPATMLGDREQLVRLLFLALNHVRQSSASFRSPITLQLQPTQLRYKKREPLEADGDPDCISFPALALVVHTENKQIPLPILQTIYDVEGPAVTQPVVSALSPQKVNLHKEKLASIVYAHYGLLLWPHAEQLVCLLPLDVSQVREEMLALSLPREAGTQEEASITPHEKTASLARLSSFHDWIPSFESIDPFLIAEILLLLRRCYGFKRHASGQLFYVRAVGIAEWVAAWTDGHAKLVYATLLYDLVRYTRLPLSYIKANYHLIVYCFVENTIAIDSRKRLEESLLAITNRLKESLQKEHISVLYVKLAERLYDLKQASGYKDPTIVQAMAKESLTIDVELAQRYGEPGMAILLKQAAEEVLAGNKPTEPEGGMKP
ncbi:sodium:solute symporter family transporter [Candidatus Cardinium hertigii]|uniref:High-affinity proline transporter PutP n=1 Tax=Candidatus Cardinium hertigii TaxID=247481 RepID=A0A2Z3LCJ3_9BACT|nr:HD domain-containing protein [Candidatus Cardinium hertigii]AWN81636.1 High-affinity proline transporter PutP [Candidatus Cardinium hertigii]